MEIISVTRGDHPSDPWRLSPSIKGMIPLRPACLIRHCFLFAMAKLHISVAAAVLFCAIRYTSSFIIAFCLLSGGVTQSGMSIMTTRPQRSLSFLITRSSLAMSRFLVIDCSIQKVGFSASFCLNFWQANTCRGKLSRSNLREKMIYCSISFWLSRSTCFRVFLAMDIF